MSKVSKLVIKACNDNKFSSFTGEFITSINPEDLTIKSGIAYHIAQGMASPSLLHYRNSPPRLLSFSLLFDNSGIIPGSNTLPVMEEVKKLQDIAYSVQKKKNSPNYIRVIWGELDFKGRLAKLDVTYAMFQVDGTLVRAEAHIAILEELVSVNQGKASDGIAGERVQASGAHVAHLPNSNQGGGGNGFAATPDGVNGAYSGAPAGAYAGGPDDVYHATPVEGGDRGDAQGLEGKHGTGAREPTVGGEVGVDKGQDLGAPGSKGADHGKPLGAAERSDKLAQKGASLDRSKDSASLQSGTPSWVGNASSKTDSLRKLGGSIGAASAGVLAAKLALNALGDKLSLWKRLKMLAKKVVPKVHNAAKHAGGKVKDIGTRK